MIESLDEKKCNGCGICAEICVMDVFRMGTKIDILSRSKKKRPSRKTLANIAYPNDCMTCFSCELKCPTGAIKVGYAPKQIPQVI
jgi:NAD-dependent dihydropyrimidine dehydrogenase PreA subunit